jgi:ribosomal protein L11 methyltransferase
VSAAGPLWWRVCAIAEGEEQAQAGARVLFAEGALAVERGERGPLGHFLREREARAAAAALRAETHAAPAPDWAAEWLAEQRSALISPRLFVTSAAAPRPAPPGAHALLLDPGLAFGDGHHATTALCLAALDEAMVARPAARTLDVGTGTGVLALAALALGARGAVGTDVDPLALRAARRNARLNGVADEALALSEALPAGRFDLALANVPEEAHAALAAPVSALLSPGAPLLLSGYAPDRAALVEARWLRAGARLRERRERSGWALSLLQA